MIENRRFMIMDIPIHKKMKQNGITILNIKKRILIRDNLNAILTSNILNVGIENK